MKKVTLFARLMMITTLLSFFGFQSSAQNLVEIGTYSGTISYIPFYGFYNYGFSKTIYSNTNFGSSGAKLITKIGYNAYSVTTGSNYILNLSCFMKEVDYTSWSTNTIPNTDAELIADGYTLVWSGNCLPVVGWNEFTLNGNFLYSGSGHLAIIWKNMDGAYSGNRYASWSRFTGITNQGVYRYFDSPVPPPFGSGTYSSTPPLLRVYYFPPTQGVVQGTVTDVNSGDPIPGAVMNASSAFGEASTFTNNAGFYSMSLYTMGTNFTTVTATKAGYETGVNQVQIPANGTATSNFALGEDKVPVSSVLAEIVQADVNVVKISWGVPDGFYEILYDDGVLENMIAWQTGGSYNALKFTPGGYPCTIHYGSVNIGNGNYPPGGDILQPFNIAIFDDDGEDGFPGTKLAEVEVTPTAVGWVAWDISDRPVVINSGDFYVAMQQGGDYPDCAPIAVDETDPVFRSYQKFGTSPWYVSAYNDFMIRTVVSSPGGIFDRADDSKLIQGTRGPRGEILGLSEPKMKTGHEGEGLYVPIESGDSPRSLSHYKVYRVKEFDENIPGNWTLLAGFVTNHVYYDNAWNSLPAGGYRWAVVAVYESGDSPATLSNMLGKNWTSDVTVNVTLSSNQLPEGAYVTFINQDGLTEHAYSAICDATGVVQFKGAWNGTYDLTVSFPGYVTYTNNNYFLNGSVVFDVELQEITDPAQNLFVDPLTLLATWDKPGGMKDLYYLPFQDQAQYNTWTENPSGSNWAFTTSYGNPAPGAWFYWSPSITNYSQTLTSPVFDYKAYTYQLVLEYDVYLSDFASDGLEHLAVEVFDGENWIPIRDWANTGSFNFTHYVDYVQEYANQNFQVRFRAYGADCYNINWWTVDNVKMWSFIQKNPIGFTVYLDDFISGFTTDTFWQYNPELITWGQTYTSAVSCYYASGHSTKIFYTWTSHYLPPPTELEGEDVGHTAHLTWSLAGAGEPYWIIYDTGTADNAMAWYDPGAEVAVRFTPLGYPCTIKTFMMYTWDGSWPAGNYLTPFRVRIYADAGGMPGAQLGQSDQTATSAFWLTVDLSALNIVITSGDFWLAHYQLGTYPDVPPTGICSAAAGQGRCLDHAVGAGWGGPSYDLYMIRAGVQGPMGDNMVLDNGIGDFTPAIPDLRNSLSVNVANPAAPAEKVTPKYEKIREAEYGDLLGFKVYRDGSYIGQSDAETLEYYDAGLAAGYYDYEVSAVYDNPTPGESMKSEATTVYINGEGTIFGTVSEFGNQFIPIHGALVTATGSWGTWTAYTANNGSYILEGVTEDTYTMTCEAAGFETQVLDGVVVADEQNVEVNFELLEFPYPVIGVTATRNAEQTEVFVDWYEYSDFYQIVYDDNEADNVTAWQKGGNMHALRFTPMAYPAELFAAQINIYDGTWPTGANTQPFEVAVFDDNGPGGLPGTEFGRVTVDPFAYGWVEVDLASLGVSIPSGDFYIAMVQGGDYPNCVPIAIDEDAMAYRSYSRDVSLNQPWQVSEFADFMIRAFVYDESKGMNIIGYTQDKPTVTFTSGSENEMSLNPANMIAGTYKVGDATFKPVKESDNSREIESYTVYVLEEGEESNPAVWTEKAEVTETSYLDTDWDVYPKGMYRYAVVANYSFNTSDPAFSNVLANKYEHTVTLNIRTNDGSPAVGAQVLLASSDGDPNKVYSAISPENGVVQFYKQIWDGTYDLSVTLDYYNPYSLMGISILNDLTLNVNLMEIFLPPACFNVDNLTGVATWCPPVLEYETVFEEGFEGGSIPAGWTQEYLTETQTPWIVRTGSSMNIPDFAHEGTYNAFFIGSTASTRLVTPPIDLSDAAVPKLTFWHTQPKGAAQDELKVYYRTAPGAIWRPLASYIDDIRFWRGESIALPNATSNYQVGFAGDCGQASGYGICLDEIKILGGMAGGREISDSRVLEGYNVYLDGIKLAYTTELTYTYTDLVLGQYYVGGVQAVYSGGESIIVEKGFVYYICDVFPQPADFAGSVNGMSVILTWTSPQEFPGIYEDFLSPVLPDNWLFSSDEWSAPGDSYLYMNASGAGNWEGAYYDEQYEDFTFEAELTKTGGSTSESIGMTVRASSWMDQCTGYLCNITQGGSFSVFKMTGGGGSEVIQGWTSSGAINTGFGAYNVVTIVGVGSNIQFYCNGQLLVSFNDATYPSGYLTITPYTGTAGTAVAYDYYMIMAAAANGPIAGDVKPISNMKGTPYYCEGEVSNPPVPAIGLIGDKRDEFELIGFNVWRDGVVINPEPLSVYTEQYIDVVSPGGIYYYNLTSVYDFGQSCPLDPPYEAIVGGDLMPPINLQAFLLENDDVLLTWTAPGAPTGQWITWDDGEYFGRVGLNGAATWYNAHMFAPADLISFDGWYLTKVRFVPSDVEGICDFTLKVWTGENAANEVVSQPIGALIQQEYNTVMLNNPLMIDASQKLYIGFEMVQAAAGYPAGRDEFTNYDGKGNLLSFDAIEWEAMSVYGIAGDWNIQGWVASEVANYAPTAPLVKKVVQNSGDLAFGTVKTDQIATAPAENRGLIGYNLWRNGANFDFVPTPDTSYTDAGLNPGTYEYYVSAVYDEGESFAEGPAYATVTGRGTLKGYVYDAQTGSPVIMGTVSLPGGYTAQTGYDGKYIMENIPAGTFDVTCEADGYNTKVIYGVVIKHQQIKVLDIGMYDFSVASLPFFEPWDSESFDAQGWTFDPSPSENWVMLDSDGNPAPTAMFYWSPQIENYSQAMVSPFIDATAAHSNVTLKFDLYLSAYSYLGDNFMTVEVWNGTSWVQVAEFDDTNDIEWTTFKYDVSAAAMGKLTQVRFVGNGIDSYNINWWFVDNIKVYESVTYTLWGTVTELAGGAPIEGAMVSVPGYPAAYSNADGEYYLDVEPGTYDVTCSAECFNPIVVYNLAISGDLEKNFALNQPILVADPLQIVVDLAPYGVTTEYVTVSNDGNGVLHWMGAISPEITWASLGVTSGTLAPGQFVEVPVFIAPEGLFEPGDVLNATINFTEELGCSTADVAMTMTIIVGMDDLTGGMIQVYPNPATDYVKLLVTDDVTEIRVMNYVGQVMDAMNVTTTKLIQLNTSSYATGTYMIEFRNANGDTVTKSVVITR
ncbi:MAG TPA: carboxypeptidase regulatory-like domain-containing protein [Bacteroidales bacterium]|nr:carboxypeptidase regulatory-like domain-containing protein [Bacteroidales bacterium]